LLLRIVGARQEERTAFLWSFAYFFALMCSWYLVRPVREVMGVSNIEKLPWMFASTFFAMLVLVPLYAAVVAKFPREQIIPIVYRFFVVNMLAFWGLLHFWGTSGLAARAFYVWTSVFNLFVVSVFWSFMAELFTLPQGKRLFGPIAAGGSLGALVGPSLAILLVRRVGPQGLLLLGAACLELATQCTYRLRAWRRRAQPEAAALSPRPIGGGLWAGIVLVFRRALLCGIAAQTLLTTITATFLYLQQARIVKGAIADPAQQTQLFGKIDLAVNVLAIVMQAFGTSRLVSRLGLGVALAVPAVTNAIASLCLFFSPTVPVLAVFQTLRRASHYGVERPARDALFTATSAEEKYKAKGVLDTLVYRGGDALGSVGYAGLTHLGLGVSGTALCTLPLCAAWLGVAFFLSRRASLEEERYDHHAT
jgi:AAA family ATP:ADP antiporter